MVHTIRVAACALTKGYEKRDRNIFELHFYRKFDFQVHKEIDDVVGGDRQPVLEDRNALPYANAVLIETQRVQPVAPNAAPHQTNYETELLGYTIPAKTSKIKYPISAIVKYIFLNYLPWKIISL